MRGASLLLALLVVASVPSFADEMEDPYHKCVKAIASAAQEIVDRDYKDNPPLGVVPIAALDNLGCHERHLMANIAIKVRLQGNEEKFALFHIHATSDGKLVSAAVEKPWTVFTNMAQFKIAWCALMNWSQKSLEEQGCVEAPKDALEKHRHQDISQ